jgi:hypothetical protein
VIISTSWVVQYDAATDTITFNGSPSLFFPLDNDNITATGYNVYGLGEIETEVSWQNNFCFAQEHEHLQSRCSIHWMQFQKSRPLREYLISGYRIPRVAIPTVLAGESCLYFLTTSHSTSPLGDGGSSESSWGFVYGLRMPHLANLLIMAGR